MNIEKWIEENGLDCHSEYNHIACRDEVVFDKGDYILKVNDLRALLKTHAIVPRDMPYETLAKIKSETPATVRKMLNIFIEESERDDGCDI